MTYSSQDREKKILEHLQKQGSASIQELVDVFGVSNMTIHRDINKLVGSGHLHKKHGGVSLATSSIPRSENQCTMCNKPISDRTIFIVRLANGEQKRACCAHCGLMIQGEEKNPSQSLSADYLHGHMISANQAFYILGSELNICCIPSVLSFGSREEAEKFNKGFGGTLAGMNKVIQYLQGMVQSHE